MSGAEERQARSVALEKAYVHEVYEQISNSQYPPADTVPRGRTWPKVKQFLTELEPGSLVCDVGCGNGKYLNVNPSVFKVGADRCSTLTDMAREKEHEVMLCDNLALPFRDETFDAVLSVAVVHHFATTERRVGALRELARVLRIGGRLIISVWAMEQRHRKFESQDVLVPWHRPQHLSTPSLELTSTTTTSEEDLPPPYHAYTQTSDSDSCRSVKAGAGQRKRGRSRHKGRSIDPARPCSSSQSSSSLSSPNETCYSFVRRALQKLAGGKRGGSRHRPWFMDSWSACTKEPPAHRYDPEGCEDGEDIQDLPIELRRLEDDHDAPQRRQTFACARQSTHHEVILNHKSKSLSDILTVGQRSMVRSRSSVPSLGVPVVAEPKPPGPPTATASGAKPRLVKQKKSLCEEEGEEEGDEPTDMRDLVKALPEFKVIHGSTRRCGGVFKQSSMNEELMSTERLREKEKVRQNIQKQASLNEELIYRRHPRLDSLRDTLFSTSTAKRFQILKNGLTNKLKSSTTGIEKVAGSSFKNGFVRILQGWKGSEVSPNVRPFPTPAEPMPPRTPPADCMKPPNACAYDASKDTVRPGERRHSKEDGSDSSKDSSLQSDTSVDSEDSFASVIFVPKPDPPPDPTNPNGVTSPLQVPLQVSPPKSPHPTSPTVKHSSQPTSPRIKQPPVSPTFKQTFSSPKPMLPPMKPISPSIKPISPTVMPNLPIVKTPSPISDEPVVQLQPLTPTNRMPRNTPSAAPQKPELPVSQEETQPAQSSSDSAADSKHSERLRQIKELLRTRTSSRITGGSSSRSPFPMVRRSTTLSSNRTETMSRPIPRLLSLELFNPETDDMDSDSSGVSSPDSVSSVISVLTEEVQLAAPATTDAETKDITPTNPDPPGDASSPQAIAELTERLLEVQMEDEITENKFPSSLSLQSFTPPCLAVRSPSLLDAADRHSLSSGSPSSNSLVEATTKPSPIRSSPPPNPILEVKERPCPESAGRPSPVRSSPSSYSLLEDFSPPRISPSSLSLLEAAADVASSLEDAVETVIQSSPRARRRQLAMLDGDPMSVLGGYSSGGSTWSLHKGHGYDSGSDWSLNVERMAESIVKADSLSPDSWSVNNSGKSSRRVSPRRRRSRPHLTSQEPWDENCRQHLTDFAEKLSEKLLEEIDQYRMQTSQPLVPRRSPHSRVLPGLPEGLEHMDDPYLSRLNEELQDLTKLSAELQERNSFLASYNNEPINVSPSQPTITIESPKQLNFENVFENLLSPKVNREDFIKPPVINKCESQDCSVKIELDLVNTEVVKDIETWTASLRQSSEDVIEELVPTAELERVDENEEDCLNLNETATVTDSRIVVTPALEDNEPSTAVKSEELLIKDEVLKFRRKSQGTVNQEDNSSNPGSTRNSGSLASLKPGYSLESSDAGDVSEQTASGSDGSRRDTNSAGKTASTASLGPESSDAGSERLGSGSDCSRDLRYADRRTARCDGRSSSEEAPPRTMLVRQRASIQEPPEALTKTESCASSLSGSTSQESLPSDNGGGSITFHRYYHVFREGELDQLIEKYVENLHIISSYYDHANWCVVAEKVQVWTI